MQCTPIAARLAGLALAAALGASTRAQSVYPARSDKAATIRSIRALPSEDGWAVEVISTRPLVPSLSSAGNPPRLIIDLPNAHLSHLEKRLAFQSSLIAAVRIGQFDSTVARIVVDLVHPVRYTWDAAGNRLTIRVRPARNVSQASAMPAITAVQPVALAMPSTATRTVILASRRLEAGAPVTAGPAPAVLRLEPGGKVRVCPGTTVSVTPSRSGRSLMLAMSTGAIEAHYVTGAGSDSVLTPDFRILLAGSGEIDYAIATDRRGNTCVEALPGNRASFIVTELLGEGSDQVKPSERVVFGGGRLHRIASPAPGGCGCPSAMPEVVRTSAPELTSAEQGELVDRMLPGPETALLPPSKPNDVHVQVDSSFVFRAEDPANDPPASQLRELLPARSLSPPPPLTTVLPPPPPGLHRGFLGKIKGFFSAVFG